MRGYKALIYLATSPGIWNGGKGEPITELELSEPWPRKGADYGIGKPARDGHKTGHSFMIAEACALPMFNSTFPLCQCVMA